MEINMVNDDTLLVCEIVFNRYLNVLAEHPETMIPEFKRLIVDAEADVKKAQQDRFMGMTRAVAAVPTETDQANLLQITAGG